MKNTSKLASKEKEYIAKCIRRAYRKNIKMYRDNNLKSTRGKSYVIWDFIDSSLKSTFKDNKKFIVRSIKNGSWDQLILYNIEMKTLYFIMKEKRFNDIQKQKGSKHLIYILANINEGEIKSMPLKVNEQLSKLPSFPKRYIVITFDYDENTDTGKYKAYRLSSNLSKIDSEVWR